MSEYPTLYAIKSRCLSAVTFGSRFLNAPAFLAFFSGTSCVALYFSSSESRIMHSPCTSISPLKGIVKGIVLIVFAPLVTISPVTPLPLVVALTSSPLLYDKLTVKPSYLYSTEHKISCVFNEFWHRAHQLSSSPKD